MSQEGLYDELLKIIQEAIQREIMAAKLYEAGAAVANNEQAKSLLLKLAQEEKHHRDLLREQYQELAGKLLYDGEG
jgi:rubrerythrin